MSIYNSLVATYANRSLAKAAARKLQNAGFDPNKFFIVARNEEKPLEGAAVVSALTELNSEQLSCIPRENIPSYEEELKTDRLLLVAHGTPDEIDRARSVIDSFHPDGWDGNVGCAIYYGCMD